MAHKKGVGSTDNGRDSKSKRLGVKLFGGEYAIPGNIIVRQRGTQFHPGRGVGIGKDHTLYALSEGTVTYYRKRNNRRYVSITPLEGVAEVLDAPAAVVEAPVVEEAPAPEVVEETPVAEVEEETTPETSEEETSEDA